MLGRTFILVVISSFVVVVQARLPTELANQVNPYGIGVAGNLNWTHCLGKGVHCTRFLGDVTDYSMQAIGAASQAVCSQHTSPSLTSLTSDVDVYTGLCQIRDSGSFVVDCQSCDEDYVIVAFAPHSTNFTAFGKAMGVLEHSFSQDSSGLVTSATINKAGVDLTVHCPNS